MWYLNSEHHVAQRLHDFSPQSAEWNAPVVSIQVLDRTHIQAPLSYKLWCYQVHSGPIIDQARGFHTIYDGGAQIGTAEPPVPGSSFQNAEGVNSGPASFRLSLDWPWQYPSGGAGLPWSRLPHPSLTPASYG